MKYEQYVPFRNNRRADLVYYSLSIYLLVVESGGTLKKNQPNSGFFERIFDVANNQLTQLKFSTNFKGRDEVPINWPDETGHTHQNSTLNRSSRSFRCLPDISHCVRFFPLPSDNLIWYTGNSRSCRRFSSLNIESSLSFLV